MVDWLAANLRQRADYDAICRAERAQRVAIVGATDAWALRHLTTHVAIADENDAYPAPDRAHELDELRP